MPPSATTGTSLPSACWLAVGHAQHGGLAGAVKVGIEHAHACAHARHGHGQIGGGGGFAHAAFARSHGDDVFHAFDGGYARLRFVCANVGGDAQMQRLRAAQIVQGRLNAFGQLLADKGGGKAEAQADVQAVGACFERFNGLLAADGAAAVGISTASSAARIAEIFMVFAFCDVWCRF